MRYRAGMSCSLTIQRHILFWLLNLEWWSVRESVHIFIIIG